MREGLWTIDDTASYLGIPKMAVYKMTSAGTIPHLKIGGRLRFRRADIDAWLDLLSVSNLDSLAKAKRLGCLRDVTTVPRHCLADEQSLDLLQAKIVEPNWPAAAGLAQSQITCLNLLASCQENSPFHGMIKLADVARP